MYELNTKLGDNIMKSITTILKEYAKEIDSLVVARDSKRANNPVWFNRSKQVDGTWTDNPINRNEIADSIDDGYIVNMFIKDVEDKDEVLSTTLGDLLKDKFMLNMKTERECKNNTLRYMVVGTED